MEIQTKFIGQDCEICERWQELAQNDHVMDEAQLTSWTLHLASHVAQLGGLFERLVRGLGQ